MAKNNAAARNNAVEPELPEEQAVNTGGLTDQQAAVQALAREIYIRAISAGRHQTRNLNHLITEALEQAQAFYAR